MSNHWFVGRAAPPSIQWASHGTTSRGSGHAWFHDSRYPLKNVSEPGNDLGMSGYKHQSESGLDAKDTSFAQQVREEKAKAHKTEFRKATKQASNRNSGLESPAPVRNQPGVEWDSVIGEFRTTSQNRHRRENTPITLPSLSETGSAPLTTHQTPCFSPTPDGPIIISQDLTAHAAHISPTLSGKYRISVPEQPYSIAHIGDDDEMQASFQRQTANVEPKRAAPSLVASVNEGPFCDDCNNNSRWCLCPFLDTLDIAPQSKRPSTQKDADTPFTAEEDETLKLMKAENKTWKQIIEVLGRDKHILHARYKEINDGNNPRRNIRSFFDIYEKPSLKARMVTPEIAPVVKGEICGHCGDTSAWCECPHSVEYFKSTRQRNQSENGCGDDYSSNDSYGSWSGRAERQNRAQSNFQRVTAKTESEAPPSPAPSFSGLTDITGYDGSECYGRGWCNIHRSVFRPKKSKSGIINALPEPDNFSIAGWDLEDSGSDLQTGGARSREGKSLSGWNNSPLANRGWGDNYNAGGWDASSESVKSGGGWNTGCTRNWRADSESANGSNGGDWSSNSNHCYEWCGGGESIMSGGGWGSTGNASCNDGWGGPSPLPQATASRPTYSYGDICVGGGGRAAIAAMHAASNVANQQPVTNNGASAELYEAQIKALQQHIGQQDAILDSYHQPHPVNYRGPSHFEDEPLLPRPASRISNGQATGLRKEAAFLCERLASGNLSSEDRQRAIAVLQIIEGGNSEPSTTTTPKNKGTMAKSTTLNFSSNCHDNASATIALDLKMHDLTKTITKMKAFDKFQRMQQDTDRLARIEEKLSNTKDKGKASDRVSAFQKRTAREVEKLNKRFDGLLAKDTGISDRAMKQEIEDLKANMDHMNYRHEINVDGIADLDDKVQQVLARLDEDNHKTKRNSSKATETSRPASTASHPFGSSYPNKVPPPPPETRPVSYLKCGTHGNNLNWGECHFCGFNNSVPKHDPWIRGPKYNGSRYADSRYNDDGKWDRTCKEWVEERERTGELGELRYNSDPPYSAAPRPAAKRSTGQQQFGWASQGCEACEGEVWGLSPCQIHHAPSDLSSSWSMPGKVATVASSVNEDCGPIQAFSGKKKSSAWGFANPGFASSGVDTPASSWNRCDTDSQKSIEGTRSKGKSPSNDGDQHEVASSLFF